MQSLVNPQMTSERLIESSTENGVTEFRDVFNNSNLAFRLNRVATMLKNPRLTILALTATAILGSFACAGNAYRRQPYPDNRVDDRAYHDGYDRGRAAGADDAKRGRGSSYDRHPEYQNANGGRGNNPSYRQGFVTGYDEGYRQYARPTQYPPSRPSAVYRSPAADNGYRDGYADGRNDARKGNRQNPVLTMNYRQGNRGYNNRYGTLDDYKRDYRASFEQGYSQGYQESQRK
jgi:hypothetical protein